ncbi:MAG: YabP/YqfC family sporulation protein [Clostridia bacterium]|nr:YabP/YqfC family sporulation protein [Clostridia bacterium]
MQENSKHSVVIDQRKLLNVSGVESVTSFSEVKITLALFGGERLNVIGSGLKITGFSKANGSFVAEGEVTGISYGGKGFASRIFK